MMSMRLRFLAPFLCVLLFFGQGVVRAEETIKVVYHVMDTDARACSRSAISVIIYVPIRV